MVASTLPARVESLAFDAAGKPLRIVIWCRRCGRSHPLEEFGLRTMSDGTRRNQPVCRRVRGAHPKPPMPAEAVEP
jgi:hypothetical protein